jgi:hypothetical protein
MLFKTSSNPSSKKHTLSRWLLDLILLSKSDEKGMCSLTVLKVSASLHSHSFEQYPIEIIQQAQRSQWLAENKCALDECNRRIELHGTFSDGLRRF